MYSFGEPSTAHLMASNGISSQNNREGKRDGEAAATNVSAAAAAAFNPANAIILLNDTLDETAAAHIHQ